MKKLSEKKLKILTYISAFGSIIVVISTMLLIGLVVYSSVIKNTYYYTLNSKSYKELKTYINVFQTINKNLVGKPYNSYDELVFDVQNKIGQEEYDLFYYLISKKSKYIYPSKYELEKFYIPSKKDISKLLLLKNKNYSSKNSIEFEIKKSTNNIELSNIMGTLTKSKTDSDEIIDKIIDYLFKIIFIGGLLLLFLVCFIGISNEKEIQEKLNTKQEEIKRAEKENPSKIGPIWELSRLELGENIIRSRKRADLIFYTSFLFIIVGILGIGLTILLIFNSKINISILVGIVSVILEFFGGTFIFLYKSTTNQLEKNILILDNINNVGMSLRILDSLDISDDVIKAKIEIAKLLIKS